MEKQIQLQQEIEALTKMKLEAIKAQQFERAATIRDQERQLQRELEQWVREQKGEAGEMASEDADADPYLLNKIVADHLGHYLKKSMEEEGDPDAN